LKLLSTCVLAAVIAAQAQQFTPPKIGAIEYYGIHKLSEARIAKTLGLKPGDPMPPSKGDTEDRLEKIPGLVEARLEAVCCQPDGRITLFVGIEEKGAPHFALRSEPTGTAALPQDVLALHQKLVTAVEAAVRRGSTAEDLTLGHSLMADADAREIQQALAQYAKDHLAHLRDVLRNSDQADHRAIAATVIGYAPDKTKVTSDLEYAMQDPDESVRGGAMRSLEAIAVLAARQPDLEIRISPTWFIEMLNSISLSDRFKAATALVNVTEKDAKPTLQLIYDRALGSVLEMAQWQSLRYALPAYILLGRMAGVSEQNIEQSWQQGNRDAVVMRFAGKR
jgi:hypothetical protein